MCVCVFTYVFVIEPSAAVNVGMAIQTEGRRLVSALRSLVSWLVGWLHSTFAAHSQKGVNVRLLMKKALHC